MAYDSDEEPQQGEEGEEEKGRCVTVRFTGDQEAGGGDLDVWVEEGESVGSVKEKVSPLLSDCVSGDSVCKLGGRRGCVQGLLRRKD